MSTTPQKHSALPGLIETKNIAEEGFIYGLPIVMNYAVMHQFCVDKNSGQYKGPFNVLFNDHRVFTYEDTAIVTPNSDTPYSMLWLDLRAEPMVISVPAVPKERYYSVQFIDGNTYNYGYIGSRATGIEPGDYFVAGPDWKGETPAGIKKLFLSTTPFGLTVIRTQLFTADDMPNVQKVQSGYKAQPLSAYLKKPAPPAPPTIDFLPATTAGIKENFFDYLDCALRFVPRATDRVGRPARARRAERALDRPGEPDARRDQSPGDRVAHVADQVGDDVGARRLGIGRVAHEPEQRIDDHDRFEDVDALAPQLQRRAAARRLAQRHADRGEVQPGADQGEGVEEFVVAEDPRREFGPLRAVKDGADGVRDAPGDDEREAQWSAAAVDLGHDQRGEPAHDQEGDGVRPLRGVHRELAYRDAHERAGADDDQRDQADRAVHGQPSDGEVRAGDGQEDRRVVGPPPGLTLARRPVHAVQQRARDQHRPDAEQETADPPHLGPGGTAREEDRRAGEEHEEGDEVKPSAQQRSRRRALRVRRNRRTAHDSTLGAPLLSSVSGR